jgi:hypothetical protein
MDVESFCIFCNWVNSVVWPYFGAGGFGAAAAAAAAAGAFGPGGIFGPPLGDAFNGRGASGTWPEYRSPYWPDDSPIPDNVDYLYQTSVEPEAWEPYWPGFSPLPRDGSVTPVVVDPQNGDIKQLYKPKKVEPITGLPIWEPLPGRATSGQGGARG